jgi:hypothetical protein
VADAAKTFSPLSYQSFSGADVQISVYVPPQTDGTDSDTDTVAKFTYIGTLATLTISTARTVGAVRTLGQSHVHEYTGGARTIAGSMIFTVLDKTSFGSILARDKSQLYSDDFYMDLLPPFAIFITSTNERGDVSRQTLFGVRLVNYGTTYSIMDMQTEETYTYVASFMSPMLPISEAKELLRNVAIGSTLARDTFLPRASQLLPKKV